jgi:hypothetical protein
VLEKEEYMHKDFEVVNVRLFLEPPLGVGDGATLEVMASYFPFHVPETFGRMADITLKLGERLLNYLTVNPWPDIEYIQRIKSDPERLDFFAGLAKSPWDCCYAPFSGSRLEKELASLLVEYAMTPRFTMEESERQFVYLEARKIYTAFLTDYKMEHPTCSLVDAAHPAFASISDEIKRRYGIPKDRLVEVLKEGHERWQAMSAEVHKDIPHFSFEHQPKLYKTIIPSPPSKPGVYKAEVKEHPINWRL